MCLGDLCMRYDLFESFTRRVGWGREGGDEAGRVAVARGGWVGQQL